MRLKKNKLRYKNRWIELIDDVIFVFNGTEESFYEFESEEVARKAWENILTEDMEYKARKRKKYPDELAYQVIENRYLKFLTAWI